MKRILTSITIFVSFLCFFNNAHAQNNAVNGIIIGGGAGAIAGQAIGRNTESTIIGATVGSVLGLIVGSEVHRRPYRPHRYQPPVVVYKPARPHHPHYPKYVPKHKKHYSKERFHRGSWGKSKHRKN